MKRWSIYISVLGLILTLFVGVGSLVNPASAAATCPNTNWSVKDGRTIGNNVLTNWIIRDGDGTACGAVGAHSIGDDTVLHCWSFNGQHRWAHVRDLDIGVSGWIRQDMLNIDANAQC